MEIVEGIQIELKPDDVKEIIKDYFKDKYIISGVNFRISSKCTGIGMNESYVDYLECVQINARINHKLFEEK